MASTLRTQTSTNCTTYFNSCLWCFSPEISSWPGREKHLTKKEPEMEYSSSTYKDLKSYNWNIFNKLSFAHQSKQSKNSNYTGDCQQQSIFWCKNETSWVTREVSEATQWILIWHQSTISSCLLCCKWRSWEDDSFFACTPIVALLLLLNVQSSCTFRSKLLVNYLVKCISLCPCGTLSIG